MTTTVGLLIFDRVEELDFVGPWEVFTMARKYDPEPPYDIAGWIPPSHVPEA